MGMENRYRRMEDSLRQTAELGLEVLHRVKSREVDWSTGYKATPRMCRKPESKEVTQEGEDDGNLEQAFDTIANFMHHTMEQCKMFHKCMPASSLSKQEMNHICRFHWRRSAQMVLSPGASQSCSTGHLWDTDHHQPIKGQREPHNVCIEVAPGTYSISAGLQKSQRQTQVVNITPGQSVDLTFSL
ncbi:A-kinase-interacting protein 1 isoform X2 [Bombina bombina]|uniref:A-kinase-interacting protein 1 isoform X2 n=1 Tax=Bombina bombina TaxID=8345 RepID=UPI00235AEE54|nr:A-kinase-interacting protein 1 isoform X2 [Bombina bombina]